MQSQGTGFKHEETTRNIVLHLLNEYGDPVRPDATHTWVAKVSDGDKYVGDFKVKIDNTDIVVDSEDFTQLPPNAINDDYYLEVWETWEDGDKKETSIFPSPKDTIQFHIYPNIQDQDTTEIQKIGFQQLVNVAVEQAGLNLVIDANSLPAGEKASVKQAYKDGKNYVTFNIPRGDQGPRGFQGPAGKNFQIKQTFPTIAAMNASGGSGFEDGDFALISSNTQDEDNAKLYVWNGSQFNFMTDMSGSQGIQGPTGPYPVMNVVSVTASDPGSQLNVNYTKRDGGYDVTYVLPRGEKGDTGPKGNKGNDAVINVISQADYDALTDKTGVYFIEG